MVSCGEAFPGSHCTRQKGCNNPILGSKAPRSSRFFCGEEEMGWESVKKPEPFEGRVFFTVKSFDI